jgi:hypothetical protein
MHLHCEAATDTLSLKEKMELRDALMKTPLGANFQADIYSQKGDSAKAGEYLLKSDPHYMMFLGQTPETLPEFLSRFRSSKADKDGYIELFTKAYNAPKSEYYHAFRNMKIEDNKIRKLLDNCSSKDSCKRLSKQMAKTDSLHTAYLYNYIKKNGWPRIEHGGLYANLLAIHDHRNHAFYIPHLKTAIKQGQNIMDALEILYYYNSKEQHGDALQAFLDTTQKVTFDVSSLLNFKLPTTMNEIRKAFKDHCPVEYYLVLYSYKVEVAENWDITANARRHTDPQGHILQQFFSRARKDCPRYKGDEGATWQLNYLRSDTRRSKMMLYVLYK